MFYKEIINVLSTDSNIANTVTTYLQQPAIFSNEAPEDAKFPYIVIRIDSTPLTDKVVSTSTLYIDYYDYNKTRLNSDAFAISVEDRLESNKITSENFTDIRFSLLNTGYIPESDPRTIHYNSTFSCRGARSGWMRRTKA